MVLIKKWPTLSQMITEDQRVLDLMYQQLSCEKPQTRFNQKWGKQYIRLFSKKHHFFPTGLMYYVRYILKKEGIAFTVEEQYQVPQPIGESIEEIESRLPFSLRSFQKEAIRSCLMSERGIIESPTASGKSLIIASVIKAYGHKAVVLVFNVNQATTIIEEVESLDISYQLINSGRLADDFAENPWTTDTVIITAKTLYTNIGLLQKVLQEAPLLLIDEVHRVAAKTHYTAAMALECPIRFGLSATTRGRSDNLDLKIRGVVGRTIYKIESSDLMEKGVIANAECKFIEIFNDVSGDDWTYLVEEGIVHNHSRNLAIKDIVKNHPNDKILILVSRINHGEILEKLLSEDNILCSFAHGSESVQEREEKIQSMNKDELDCLILSPFGSTGINIPDVSVLIIAGGGRSEIDSIQKVGRGLRKGRTGRLKIYDFMDIGSSVLNKHSKNRRKTYKKIGISIKKE